MPTDWQNISTIRVSESSGMVSEFWTERQTAANPKTTTILVVLYGLYAAVYLTPP